MSKLKITFACWDYDRMLPLMDGSVPIDGVDLNFLNLPVEETFFRQARHQEFQVSEMSFSSYCVSLMAKDPAFIALPVFPSRIFRHSCIFTSAKSGIKEPKDLIGKKVGIPEYQMSAPVWIRGILNDEYGVSPSDVEYFTGGEEETGRIEKITLNLPPEIKVTPIGPEQTLSQMIADGEIDALYSARAPSTLYTRPNDVKRLFEDYKDVEQAYYKKTQIFPIMHLVVLRRDVYEANPWLAQSLYKAFLKAQDYAYNRLQEMAALKTMLPWQIHAVEEATRVMGERWWPYGLESNRHVLEKFLGYHHHQGLSSRLLEVDELFAPESLEQFKI